jgi:prepilin-type N-terminal cleavage/methylation domain-containing protein
LKGGEAFMKKQARTKKDGFTIIEVALVLAIAGLIFLMVFLILPGVQAGQRDSERRNAVTSVVSQLSSYKTNNRGALPANGNDFESFLRNYMDGDNFTDPKEGVPYKAQSANSDGDDDLELGFIQYIRGFKCDGETATARGTSREAAVRIKLESGGHFCQDAS